MFKTICAAAVIALSIGSVIVASIAPASACYSNCYHYHGDHSYSDNQSYGYGGY